MTMAADGLRVPIPLYRHAAPSAPWPWMDLKRDRAEVVVGVGSATSTLVEGGLGEAAAAATMDVEDGEGSEGSSRAREGDTERSWHEYPQSLFGNWTPDQVRRCRMFEVMGQGQGGGGCVVYSVDMVRSGFQGGEGEVVRDERTQGALRTRLWAPRSPGVRLRALFVERMSAPVLQMLGTRYNVEPFFFASSANWIPSRYQEDMQPGKGDHITVVLPFVRVIRTELVADEGGIIDTQAPLHLSDLLAFHMVRTTTSDTILSYHPDSMLRRGSATLLRSLLRRTGDSVYWSKLYEQSKDSTIVLLALLWHAVYAWDEVLEVLYDYLNKTLEAREFSTRHVTHARALHKVRAHLICYKQLLWDFRATVAFVKTTANPAMNAGTVTAHDRKTAADIHQLETDNLLAEVERLEKQREMQTDRVANVMNLAVSTVKNEDTRAMHGLTKVTMRDAATIKQISYFTLVFLPGYFMAGVFRMNVKEVNPNATESLAHYIEGTVIFTLCTAWLVIALQETSSFHPGGRHVLRRVAWPVFFIWAIVQQVLGDEKGRMRWRWMASRGPCHA